MDKDTAVSFKEIVETRYAVKAFDGQRISDDDLTSLLEMIRLSPTSFNVQPWKVKVIGDEPELKAQLKPATWNQPQVTTCSHLLVFCANLALLELTDKLEAQMIAEGAPEDKIKGFTKLIRDFIQGMDERDQLAWAQKQIYIALSHGMNGAKALGFDACPLEGFVSQKYAEILELPDGLVPTVLLAVGYASDVPRDKLRFAKEDLFF